MNTYNDPFRNRTSSVEFMRAFTTEYNQTIRTHNDMMLEYNRNIANIIDILNRSPDTPPSTPVRSSSRSDIASLIYLLSQTDADDRLSRVQIENATQNVAYTVNTFNETQCPISLDDFVENEMICQIIHCRHIFKQRNLMIWLETHTCCPVCRHNLREPLENTNTWSNLFNRDVDISGNDV